MDSADSAQTDDPHPRSREAGRSRDSQRVRRVSPVTPDTPRGRAVTQRARRNVKRSHGRGGRRRNDGSKLVIISWRDIPAQVNGGSGDKRIQRILPRRFQRAIDRAATVAGKTEASQYVAEWRRVIAQGDPSDPQRATLAAAAELEEAFPMERLDRFVEAGGWDPDQM